MPLAQRRAVKVMCPLLSVEDLSIFFLDGEGETQVAKSISFEIEPGQRLGIVGESGCGKTVTGLSILRLLPTGITRIEGRILFDGQNLAQLSPAAMRRVRGRHIGMIFQEPMSALDPVFTVGEQISETLRAHFGFSRSEARARGIAALADVGIPLPARRFDEYPHQLSGGMQQRVMIAMAIVCEPKLIIADEPTTALDVTIQAQIIELLCNLGERTGAAMLFISHDLGVVSETCTRLLTMYAGEIVEDAPVDAALERPRHPYTSGLLRSMPHFAERRAELPSIPGRVPSPRAMPAGCRFRARCTYAIAGCETEQPMRRLDGCAARCWRIDEIHLPGAIN